MVRYWTCMICGKRCKGDRIDPDRDLCADCLRNEEVGGSTGYCRYCGQEVIKKFMVNCFMCMECARRNRYVKK